MFKNDVYMISTKNSAAGMRDAVKKLAPLAVKLAKGEKIGSSAEEGYIPNGVRVNFFEKERGSKRAVMESMILQELQILQKRHMRLHMADMIRYMRMKIRTVYFR